MTLPDSNIWGVHETSRATMGITAAHVELWGDVKDEEKKGGSQENEPGA